VFTRYYNFVDHCCAAWNKLTDQPWRIMTIAPQQLIAGKNVADSAEAAIAVSSETDKLRFKKIEQDARARAAELAAK